IYLEDTSPLLGCYGNDLVQTPNIDSLARKGILFTHVFMPAPVCSPCRSSLITGMMATTLGVHNHHSSRTEASAIYLPDSVLTIPEIFNTQGYFTFNNGKDDYNFSYDREKLYDQAYLQHPLYGKKGDPIDLAILRDKAPFFGQIQLAGGKEIFSSSFGENNTHPVDRSVIQLPPYLPEHPAIIEEYANHLDAIQITDRKVGEIMKGLADHELLENTVIFFFSDHGMRLTRHKQFLYDGGLHVPLIVADFRSGQKLKPGTINDQLISGLDLGITALSLAGITPPGYMEGQDIFNTKIPPRTHVISTRDRCDFTIDRIRSVRSKDFKYIRNFMTDRPYSQLTYMDVDGVEFVKVMKALHAAQKLDSVQVKFFRKDRPAEELYDLDEDPFEIRNLASDPNYADVRTEMSAILDQWIQDSGDKGQFPENEEGLKLMLGIWGKNALNPEYDRIRRTYPDLEGSLWSLKSAGWVKPL
ncbi:MAG: sulfatase, partial [Saprospiraceae bacterium]|nr:sulfatase [Saprospiraceae bacterium]